MVQGIVSYVYGYEYMYGRMHESMYTDPCMSKCLKDSTVKVKFHDIWH